MIRIFGQRSHCVSRGVLTTILAVLLCLPSGVAVGDLYHMPPPGEMVYRSPEFVPPQMVGMRFDVNQPFHFEFMMDTGTTKSEEGQFSSQAMRLIKYFLAGLAIPEDDLWVNLSPQEPDRMIPHELVMTDMGRDLLTQDYLLKQFTATLLHPEDHTGRAFWKRVHQLAHQKFGTTEVPMNTFNKVWVVPEEAKVYQDGNTAYVVESSLRVLMEEDYLSSPDSKNGTDDKALAIAREILIPEIEHEINHGKQFAPLRQIYSALILATWYKEGMKESFINRMYADKGKVKGIDLNDPDTKSKVYSAYMHAFRRGVYNVIREDYDPYSQRKIPRHYISGGMNIKPRVRVIQSSQYPKPIGAMRLVSAKFDLLNANTRVDLQSISQDQALIVEQMSSDDRNSRIRRLLDQRVMRPEPQALLGIMPEEIAMAAQMRRLPVHSLGAYQQMHEIALPVLEAKLQAVMDHHETEQPTYVILSRDGDMIYDMMSLMNESAAAQGRVKLVNISLRQSERFLNPASPFYDESQLENMRAFLQQEGLSAADLQSGRKFVFIDSAYKGSIFNTILRINGMEREDVGDRLTGYLVFRDDERSLYDEVPSVLGESAVELRDQFHRVYQSNLRDLMPDFVSTQWSALDAERQLNFLVALYLQIQPKFLRNANAVLEIDGRWHSLNGAYASYHEDFLPLDELTFHNPHQMDPVAALQLQAMTVEYFLEKTLSDEAIIVHDDGRISFYGPYIVPSFTFFAVRHGETPANAAQIFQGATDEEMNQLSDQGREDARRGALQLYEKVAPILRRGEKVIVMTSALTRTKDTAQAFLDLVEEKYAAGELGKQIFLEVIEDAGLNEINFGTLSNKNPAEYSAAEIAFERKYRQGKNAALNPPQGESYRDLIERGRMWLDRMNTRMAKDPATVIVFGHGTFLSTLQILTGIKDMTDDTGRIDWISHRPQNGEVVVFKDDSAVLVEPPDDQTARTQVVTPILTFDQRHRAVEFYMNSIMDGEYQRTGQKFSRFVEVGLGGWSSDTFHSDGHWAPTFFNWFKRLSHLRGRSDAISQIELLGIDQERSIVSNVSRYIQDKKPVRVRRGDSVKVEEGNFGTLSEIPAGSVDVIRSMNVFTHYRTAADHLSFVSSVNHALRPGGLFVRGDNGLGSVWRKDDERLVPQALFIDSGFLIKSLPPNDIRHFPSSELYDDDPQITAVIASLKAAINEAVGKVKNEALPLSWDILWKDERARKYARFISAFHEALPADLAKRMSVSDKGLVTIPVVQDDQAMAADEGMHPHDDLIRASRVRTPRTYNFEDRLDEIDFYLQRFRLDEPSSIGGHIVIIGFGSRPEQLTDVAKRYPNANIIGVEIHGPSADEAEAYIDVNEPEEIAERIRVFEGDARDLSSLLEDESVEMVIFPKSLDYFELTSSINGGRQARGLIYALLQEADRILMPQGVLVATGAPLGNTHDFLVASNYGHVEIDTFDEEAVMAMKSIDQAMMSDESTATELSKIDSLLQKIRLRQDAGDYRFERDILRIYQQLTRQNFSVADVSRILEMLLSPQGPITQGHLPTVIAALDVLNWLAVHPQTTYAQKLEIYDVIHLAVENPQLTVVHVLRNQIEAIRQNVEGYFQDHRQDVIQRVIDGEEDYDVLEFLAENYFRPVREYVKNYWVHARNNPASQTKGIIYDQQPSRQEILRAFEGALDKQRFSAENIDDLIRFLLAYRGPLNDPSRSNALLALRIVERIGLSRLSDVDMKRDILVVLAQDTALAKARHIGSQIDNAANRIEQKLNHDLETKTDAAVLSQQTPGGIDLTRSRLNVQVIHGDNGEPIPWTQQPLQHVPIDGIVPVIINIQTIPQLPLILGSQPGLSGDSQSQFIQDLGRKEAQDNFEEVKPAML